MTSVDIALVLAQSGRGAGVPLRELLLVLLTAAVVTFLTTGLIRIAAIRFGAVAAPRDRDVHVIPTPRLGGVGIYLGLVAGLVFAYQLPALTRGFEYTPDMGAALVAGSIIVVVGIIDDRWGLDALTKFVGQVTAAGMLAVMGVSWIVIFDPFSGNTLVLDQLQGGLITVAVAAVMINAMNFVDGLDGLAAGIGLIAAVAICLFSVGCSRWCRRVRRAGFRWRRTVPAICSACCLRCSWSVRSCSFRFSICCSRSCGAPGPESVRSARTRCICTTVCCR